MTGRLQQSSIARFRRGMARLAYGNPLYNGLVLSGRVPAVLAVVPPDHWAGDTEAGLDLLTGVFHHAGQSLTFVTSSNGLIVPDWRPIGASPAWFAGLHGFEWLRDLRAVGSDAARRRTRALIMSWIDHFHRWDERAWDPAVTGARVANWLAAHDFFCASADDDFRARVFDALGRQIRHLARVLPGRLTGHGLLTALIGLAIGGLCMPGQRRALADALHLLEEELARQILPDGGHAERNPSVQLAILRQLVDLCGSLRAGRAPIPEFLQHTIDRMAPALRFFRHGDGGLALFNGGREEDPAVIDAVLAHAEARGRPLKSALHAGFERLINGRTLIVMDTGEPARPGFDQDAHAGTLSFEVSIGKERLIVNCGAHPGAAEGWRAALAATAAHSTLVLAETNSSEVLRGGGLGRRPSHVGTERQETEAAVLVSGTHNGYGPNFHFLHRRRIYLTDNGEDLRGEDVVEPVLGTEPAPQPFAIRFHLHPLVRAAMGEDGEHVVLRLASGQIWRMRAIGAAIGIAESIYFGARDEPTRTQQITITGTVGGQGGLLRWQLRREHKPEPTPAPPQSE
jgi:uncharacterized heparinase superfamily protein